MELGVTGIYNILGAARAEEVIPGYFRKDQHDSGASQYVDTVRELITYGQISVVTDGADGGALRSVASYEELLEAGLRKDANVRYVGDHPGLSDVPLSSITGSFIIPFPCRATSPYPLLHRYRAYAFGGFAATGAATTVGVSNETPVDVILGLEYGTRARPSVMNGARVSSNAKFWQNIGSPPNSLPQGYVPIQNSMFLQDPGRSGYDPDAPVEIAEILSAYTSLSRTRFPSARSLINGVGAAAIEAGTITFPYPKNDEAYSYEEQLPTLDSLDQHAPYILMPDDDIILGWQYPCPEDPTAMPGSTGEASGANSQPLLNRMALSGSATLHLYGSMIKEGKAYQHGNALNQHLTSNAVHEIIGNDPVVDQFL